MFVCVEKLLLLVNAQLVLTVTFQDENEREGDPKGWAVGTSQFPTAIRVQ
jgi:hypothetical protein